MSFSAKNDLAARITGLKRPRAHLITLCLLWATILIGFQEFVVARLRPERPDDVLGWTARLTGDDFIQRVYAEEVGIHRFYPSTHVAWDSGYYLSIATASYDDPFIDKVASGKNSGISMNYAFMPLYPLLIRYGVFILGILSLSGDTVIIAVAISISLLGTFAGMLALFDIVKQAGGNDKDGIRTAFYMLIFPSGFFLAQVYTEGLFVGLAFGCLALLRRKKWLMASVLAGLAFLTRTIGFGLIVPLLCALIYDTWKNRQAFSFARTETWLRIVCIVIPFGVFTAWYYSPLGANFFFIERAFFGRQAFALEKSWDAWSNVIAHIGGNPKTTVYYILEFSGIGLAILSCLATLRRFPLESMFGIFVTTISVFSGVPQSMLRYVLAVPTIFLLLGQLGRSKFLDRIWTLISILLMAIQLALFTYDMWVG